MTCHGHGVAYVTRACHDMDIDMTWTWHDVDMA